MLPKPKRWQKLSLLVLCIGLLIPAVQVGCVRWVNPSTTGPMVLRSLQSKLHHEKHTPTRYTWMPLREVPESFLLYVWVSEDRLFFRHHGFDWRQIFAARAEARESGRPSRGASTLTQQCARSLFLWQGRSWLRKGLEAYYTLWMELLLPKQRILELYVNVIELGDGVYGLEAGAEHHFGVHGSELTAEQASLLVAILPRPRAWDPNHPTERVTRRQAIIVERAAKAQLPAEALR